MRMVEAASGTIRIDGIDISTIGLHDLRSHISVIPQNPALFEASIRENLDPYKQFTDDELWEAIRAAQVDEFINTPTRNFVEKTEKELDEIADTDSNYGPWIQGVGLDKWVEHNGQNFSIGQQQLISLCRALLWKRKIVVLDEATANVDSKTDAIMQKIIRSKFNDSTVLTIAHRLDTIMDSDRILVIDQGKAVEFDTPKMLLADKDSYFARLVESMKLNQGAP
ncbi:ATP-binding cassette bilirubin transporter bpt1, partial [Coemansia asiatica]